MIGQGKSISCIISKISRLSNRYIRAVKIDKITSLNLCAEIFKIFIANEYIIFPKILTYSLQIAFIKRISFFPS